MIRSSIEIARSAEDVFAYVDDLSRHAEWQELIVSVSVDPEGPTRVGTRATETRLIGKREQTTTFEITEHDPPRSFAFRGIDGPIRPNGRGTVDPVGDGERARLTLELTLTGHGIGMLFAPLARSQARRELPKAQQRLKEILESGTG